MKKVILVLIVFFTIMSGYSQTEKGKMLIGGQLNFAGNNESYKPDSLYDFNYKTLSFQVTPGYGYFIMDNFAIGVNLNFGVSMSNNNQYMLYPSLVTYESTLKNNKITFGVGVFARKYFRIAEKFFFLINAGIDYSYQTSKDVTSNNDPNYVFPINNPASQTTQTNSFSIAGTPGLVYFVTPKLGIQTSFGKIYYNYSVSKNISLLYDNQKKTNNYGINLNISSFTFGLNYYF